jgi:effector-binding domain-containing protein
MACVIHSGIWKQSPRLTPYFYTAWARANGSRVMGMAREVYLDGGPENLEMCRLVELQIPIDQSHPHGLDRSTNMTEMAEP